MILPVIAGVGTVGWIAALVAWRQLYRWERQLTGARVLVSYKGRTKMSPRLIDWLKWANTLQGDTRLNGQVIYKMGSTTISILKPLSRGHGKTATKTVAPEAGAKTVKELQK